MNKFNNLYQKIILEMAGTFKDEPILAKEILNCKNGYVFTTDEIKKLLKNDKNLNSILLNDENLKNQFELRILKFNPKNDKNLMKKEIFSIYNKDTNDIKANNEYEIFYEKACSSKALLGIIFNDIEEIVMFINLHPLKKCTYKDIYHELTHYFQPVENDHRLNEVNTKLIGGEEIIVNYPIEKISSLLKSKNINLSNNNILYILREREFIPHINDLCYDLKELKNKEYKDLKNDEYLKFLFDLTKSNDPLHEKFAIKLLSFSDDMLPLITFLISFYFNIEYERIKNIIIDDFK